MVSAAARPGQRPARQRRRLRPQAQLADVVRRSPSGRVPRTAGCGPCRTPTGALLASRSTTTPRIDFYGFIEMVDAVGGVDIKVKDGFEDPKYDGYGHPAARLQHHQGHAPPGRRRMRSRTPASARPTARATSPGPRASSRSSSRCATKVDQGRQPVLEAAGPARGWSATSSPRTCRSTGSRHSRPSSTRSATTPSSARSSATRWSSPSRPSTGRRSSPTSRRSRRSPHDLFPEPGEEPPAVADPQGVGQAEGHRQPVSGRAARRRVALGEPQAEVVPQRPAGGDHAANAARSAPGPGRAISRPRWSGRRNPSATAWSSHASSAAQ